jgi:hypothetical protein
MSKYSALSEYLAQVKDVDVVLTFSQIEEILGTSLPSSARQHAAWWSNEKSGSHTWAHLWQSAGWSRDKVDFLSERVTFRRSISTLEETLKNLRPKTQETIFDLLELVGISTQEWHTKAKGEPVERVKANPRFCYDWSFGSNREGYALCLWHETLLIESEKIVFNENLRELANLLYADSRDQANDEKRRQRSLTQSARAHAFDKALQSSYGRGLPVSVILTEGNRRNREELGEGSSHVQYRALDPVKWYVHKYDDDTGDLELVRGVPPPGAATGEPTEEEQHAGPPDLVQLRAIKVRQGQSQFREKLLSAYRRTCAVTGCKIVDLLEAAHIRPHAEEPNYHVSNGLLLRADVHTLFDLRLLAIDSRLRVCLSPALLNSDYKTYDGKELRQPDLPSEMPNAEALERRYREFTELHKAR